MKPRILIVRAPGGLGDQICCTAAVRAAQAKYGEQFEVCAAVGRTHWRELFHDQGYCEGGYLDCSLCRMNPETLSERFVHVFDLSGPERMHEQETQWNIQRPRVETWCRSVDCWPVDACPRWKPTAAEVEWAMAYLAGLGYAPRKFAVFHWNCAIGWFHKIWKHRLQGAELLAKQLPVLVLHGFEKSDPPDPLWDELLTKQHAGLRANCNLTLRQLGAVLSLARFGAGPDSSLLHFAAAVQLPYLGIFGSTFGAVTTKYYPLCRFMQGPIDPEWLCAKTAPCYGVRERNFRSECFSNQTLGGECLQRITPEQVVAECLKFWD